MLEFCIYFQYSCESTLKEKVSTLKQKVVPKYGADVSKFCN